MQVCQAGHEIVVRQRVVQVHERALQPGALCAAKSAISSSTFRNSGHSTAEAPRQPPTNVTTGVIVASSPLTMLFSNFLFERRITLWPSCLFVLTTKISFPLFFVFQAKILIIMAFVFPYQELEKGRWGAGASCAFELPEVGGGSPLLSLAVSAVFPPVALGLGPSTKRRSLLLCGASGIPKGGKARLDCRDDRKARFDPAFSNQISKLSSSSSSEQPLFSTVELILPVTPPTSILSQLKAETLCY
jgi:hypothetical protein